MQTQFKDKLVWIRSTKGWSSTAGDIYLTADKVDGVATWKPFEGTLNQLWRVKHFGRKDVSSPLSYSQLVNVGLSTPAAEAVLRAPNFTGGFGKGSTFCLEHTR